ncbi:PAS domain S-box protein [Mucilaginibacter sp. PAMB04274]|uniref:PAS domain S-box protein n=1 Tax=Mucilaginibacter sp. PAMB04274 TaxID=3138568 RepID=UPI0031F6394C
MKVVNQGKAQPGYQKLWLGYKRFVEESIQGDTTFQDKDIPYWKNKLFSNSILYSLPISLFAVIPSMIIAYSMGHLLIPAMDFLALASITIITLSRKISLQFKKVFVAVVLTVLAYLLTITLGSFGIGSIYLLAISVYIALLFPTMFAYRSIVVNFFFYAIIALLIHFKPFNSPLDNLNLLYWIAYSLNFLFLNIIIIVQVCHVIGGLEGTIKEEGRLLKELQAEVNDKAQRNNMLKESEGHYKTLFLLNPSPMWIFDPETLRFLQVNDAAITKYGYTQEEFLEMTIECVEAEDVTNNLPDSLKSTLRTDEAFQYNTEHCRKNGERVHVEVSCSTIPFRGNLAWLAIGRNISAQIAYTRAIEKQNVKLREIAYMQSHIIRAPLTRIMGLSDLITQNVQEAPDPKLLDYLNTSVNELDEVIKAIVNHSEEIILSPLDME